MPTIITYELPDGRTFSIEAEDLDGKNMAAKTGHLDQETRKWVEEVAPMVGALNTMGEEAKKSGTIAITLEAGFKFSVKTGLWGFGPTAEADIRLTLTWETPVAADQKHNV